MTGRRYDAEPFYADSPKLMEGFEVDAFFQPYAQRLAECNAATVFLPRETDPDRIIPYLDGLLLAGGLDVHPCKYGEAITNEATALDLGQDEFDLALAKRAIELGIPTLGTCRGHQVLNVVLGGTLRNHEKPSHNVRTESASRRAHRVRFSVGSLMSRIYGSEAEVNSAHHQAIDRVAPDFVVTGLAEDGVIEAVELRGKPVVGVQWHPEFHADLDPIFAWLAEAARERRAAASAVAS